MPDIITRMEKNYSYQAILQDKAQQLANFIADKKKEFEYVVPKMNMNKNDNVELREKVLRMTFEERKNDLELTNLHYGALRRICWKENS